MAKVIRRAGKIGISLLLLLLVVGMVFYSAQMLLFGQSVELLLQPGIAELADADTLSSNQQYAEAELIYKDVVTLYPGTDVALEAQKSLALMYIDPNESYQAVREQEIEKLLTDYSGHADLPKAVIQVANSCFEENLHQEAFELYQYVSDNLTVENQSVIIQSSLALFNSDIGIDPNAAEVDVESLIINNESDAELPEAIFDIAKRYYKNSQAADNRGVKLKASQYLQKTISSLKLMSDSPQGIVPAGPEACNILAQSYRRSGQFQKAIDTYDKLLTAFPDYQYSWHIEFAIGSCYQKMKQNGLITVEEADSLTKVLYENLLWNYPTCKAAKGAQNWLDHLAGLEKGGVK